MKLQGKLLPLISAGLCTVLLVLLLVDAIWPNANIFLNEFVKTLLLVTCVVASVCGVLLIARQRRWERGYRRARRY